MACIHKFGATINGERVAFFGTLNDEEFGLATKDGMPDDWFAWHIEDWECADDPCSVRVADIRLLPVPEGSWRDYWDDAWRETHAKRLAATRAARFDRDHDRALDSCFSR